MHDPQPFLEALSARNWYAVAALSIALLLQLGKSAPVARWLYERTPVGWRWLTPVLLGAATAFVGAYQDGQTLVAALYAALGGAIWIGGGAMGADAALTESPLTWSGGAGGKRRE